MLARCSHSFTSSTNDQLSVMYLNSLLQAAIALHALMDTIRCAEGEEGLGERPRKRSGQMGGVGHKGFIGGLAGTITLGGSGWTVLEYGQ